MSEITASQIIQWQNEMQKKGFSESYLRMIQNQLTSLFTHALRIYDLRTNPCKKVKRMGNSDSRSLDFWTKEEYQRFIQTMEPGTRYYLIFEILFWTGCRIGELLAIVKRDINFENNQISITKTYYRTGRQDIITEPKTKQSVRVVEIPEFLKQEIKDFVDGHYGMPDDERIFPIVQEAVQHKMKRQIKKAGVKDIRLHDLRHSHVAYLINKGVEPLLIKERVGHKDIRITLNTYGHLYPNQQRRVADFQKRNPNLHVFSAHLHMGEETPHVHIDFVPFIRGSKRGLDTRVSLKGALSEQGFKGGTRGMTEWNQWIESEKWELSKVMERHGVLWKQLGTHNRHLSVLDFEKQERQKEVAALEHAISDSKDELSDILYQQATAGKKTEQIRQEGEAIRQEVSELSVTNHRLQEQAESLAEDQEKLLSENEKLETRQKKLQQKLNKMVQSKEVMERNVRAYDEDEKWQLPEPGALMSAKAYREKNAMPLVARLKDVVKSLTIKCINLIEETKQLKAKVTRQAEKFVFYKDKIHQQAARLEQLQERSDDFERVKQYVGADQIDTIVTNARELEQIAQNRKQYNRAYGISR